MSERGSGARLKRLRDLGTGLPFAAGAAAPVWPGLVVKSLSRGSAASEAEPERGSERGRGPVVVGRQFAAVLLLRFEPAVDKRGRVEVDLRTLRDLARTAESRDFRRCRPAPDRRDRAGTRMSGRSRRSPTATPRRSRTTTPDRRHRPVPPGTDSATAGPARPPRRAGVAATATSARPCERPLPGNFGGDLDRSGDGR